MLRINRQEYGWASHRVQPGEYITGHGVDNNQVRIWPGAAPRTTSTIQVIKNVLNLLDLKNTHTNTLPFYLPELALFTVSSTHTNLKLFLNVLVLFGTHTHLPDIIFALVMRDPWLTTSRAINSLEQPTVPLTIAT